MTTATARTVQRMDTAPDIVTPLTMLNKAIAKGMTPDTLEKLVALHERFEANEARKEFNNSVADAKAEIPVILKNKHVTFGHKSGDDKTDYWHEDLAEIARTIDPVLSRFGLSYRYKSEQVDGRVVVTCVLSHRLGHSEATTLSAAPDASGKKNSIQQVGSAVTYLQRYTLKLSLGLAAGRDDDGKASGAPVETLDEEQMRELNELIDNALDLGNWQREPYMARFLAHMRAGSVVEIPKADFRKALAAIRSTMGGTQ